MRNYLLFITLAILFNGCEQENENINIENPKADYSYVIVGGFNVTFTNNSLYASNFIWDFGDGTTSIEKSPTHIYNSIGTYSVKLIVLNKNMSDTINKTIIIDDLVNLNNLKVPFFWYPLNLDVDGDGIYDLKLYTDEYSGTSTLSKSSTITPLNNYEISVESGMPKIYVIGDSILNTALYSKNEFDIAYYSAYLYSGSSTVNKNDNWIKDEVRYIGYRKIFNNETKIGWIKIKVLDYTNVTVYSYRIPTKSFSLLIDK